MIEINCNRPHRTATCTLHGVTIQHDDDPTCGMLRALANLGLDGPWSATDEHGRQIGFGHRLAKAARRYRPTEAEVVDIEAQAKARRAEKIRRAAR